MMKMTRATKRRWKEWGFDEKQDQDHQQMAKRRKERWERNHPPFEMILVAILPKIFSYLDNVNEVFHLSTLCKSFRLVIKDAPEIVVHAAVFQGGKSKQMMERIMESIESKTIHIPSVFRLLRLLHATMCEMGEECCAYDLEKHKPSPLLSIHRRPSSSCVHHLPFGLALCHACVEGLSGRVVFEASNQQAYDQQEQIVKQIETHPQGTLSTRLLCATHVERVTNENVGSLVLYKQAKRIESSYMAASDGVEKRKQLLEDLIVQKQNGITEKDKMLSQVYVTAFDFAMEQFDAHVGRKQNVAIAIEQAKVAKRVSRKKELSLPIYNKIEELLTGFTYKDMVLSGSWNHQGYLFTFRNWPSKMTLGSLLSAPSSASTKKVTEAVTLVRRIYTSLESMGLIGSSYPCRLELYDTQMDLPDHERAILHYFMYEKTSSDFLSDVNIDYSGQTYHQIWDAIQAGETSKTLFRACNSFEDKRNVFVFNVATNDKTESLATQVWNRHNSRWTFPTFDDFHTKYDQCNAEFNTTVPLIEAYMQHPTTAAWLKENDADEPFSRMDAVGILYVDLDIVDRYLRFPAEEPHADDKQAYAALLRLHKIIYYNGLDDDHGDY